MLLISVPKLISCQLTVRPILGAFSKVTDLVSMDSVKAVLKDKWGNKSERNIEAVERSYANTLRAY